jgi:excisionase family DNA binding protein
MSDRLEAAVRELVDALRDELRTEAACDQGAPDRLLSVAEAREALGGVSRSTLYGEIQAGRLRSAKVGRRRLVPAAAIAEYIAGSPR